MENTVVEEPVIQNDQSVNEEPTNYSTEDILKISQNEKIEEPIVDEKSVDNDTPKENAAWAAMRKENSEFKNKLDKLDALAKQSGFSDYEDFLAKAEEESITKEAEEKGLPVDVYKKIQEVENKNKEILDRLEAADLDKKNEVFISNLDKAFNANGINDASKSEVIKEMDQKGVTVDVLMSMPEHLLKDFVKMFIPINILESKEVVSKEQIANTIPISQSSSANQTLTAEDAIKDRAKSWVARI